MLQNTRIYWGVAYFFKKYYKKIIKNFSHIKRVLTFVP